MLEGWVVNSVVTLQSGMPWGTMDTNNDFYGNLEYEQRSGALGFHREPGRLHFRPNSFPMFLQSSKHDGKLHSLCDAWRGVPTPPAVCLQAAQANGALAVASLYNNGCYVSGNSVITPPAYGSVGNMGRISSATAASETGIFR